MNSVLIFPFNKGQGAGETVRVLQGDESPPTEASYRKDRQAVVVEHETRCLLKIIAIARGPVGAPFCFGALLHRRRDGELNDAHARQRV